MNLLYIPLLVLWGCTTNVAESSYIIEETWDSSMNTHPSSSVFQQVLNNSVREGLPGVVLYVKSPNGVWNGSSGYASIEDKIKMSPSHYHFSASIAKTYTATAIMLLVEDSLIELDQPINIYLPKRIYSKIPDSDKITVRNLLNHRSGLIDYLNETKYGLDFFSNPDQFFKAEEYLEYIYDKSVLFEPNSKYEYSNTNYLLLALIMDNIFGYSHTNFYRENIFIPFRLEQTLYDKGKDTDLPQEAVNSYWVQDNDFSIVNVTDIQRLNHNLAIGEAGILATSADFGRFFELLLTEKIVSQKSLNEMITMKGSSCEGFYGFGLTEINDGGIGHEGRFIGTSASVYYFPQKKTTICLLSNIGDLGNESKATELFEELLSKIIELTVKNKME